MRPDEPKPITLTPQQRAAERKRLIDEEGLTPQEAEFALDLATGTVDGDVVDDA